MKLWSKNRNKISCSITKINLTFKNGGGLSGWASDDMPYDQRAVGPGLNQALSYMSSPLSPRFTVYLHPLYPIKAKKNKG